MASHTTCCQKDPSHHHHAHDERAKASDSDRIPVTVLSGLSGSGRTTLLKKILENRKGLKVAVLVNDLTHRDRAALHGAADQLIVLENGCICCDLRYEFLVEMTKLCTSGKIDYILVVPSGISEPTPLAETFSHTIPIHGMQHKMLSDLARLDTLVTVVDLETFLKELHSNETLEQRYGEDKLPSSARESRYIANLISDQVEFANVIVLNKTDLLSLDDVDYIEAIVRKLNAGATIIRSAQDDAPLDAIVNTNSFDFTRTTLMAGWLKELRGESVAPAENKHDISSFVYVRRRPFHPLRLQEFFRRGLSTLIRMKGNVWLAPMNENSVECSGTGGEAVAFSNGGPWLVHLEEHEFPDDEHITKKMKEEIAAGGQYGDRRQQLVVIGSQMERNEIESLLDQCLLTDAEFQLGPGAWQEYENPWLLDIICDEDDGDEEFEEDEEDEQ